MPGYADCLWQCGKIYIAVDLALFCIRRCHFQYTTYEQYSINITSHAALKFQNNLLIGNDTRSMDTHTESNIKSPVKVADYMVTYVCVFVCVSPLPRLLITSGMM